MDFDIEAGSGMSRAAPIQDEFGMPPELLDEPTSTSSSIEDGRERKGLFIEQRLTVGAYVNHIITRLVIIILIILDITFVIVAVCLPESQEDTVYVLDTISLVFVIIFMIELCLRIFVEMNHFYRSWFNILDGFIIILSFLISAILTALDDMINAYKLGRIIVVGRVIRLVLLVRSVRLLLMTEGFQRSMRLTVGGNKRRYQKDGYDLDLCYVTHRVIAMSFPSSGLDGLYRNRIEHVAKFLDDKHPNKYKVYNLCSERSYETNFFHDRVERVKIDDHNVPSLKDAIRFAKDVRSWMEADPHNVIAVHCKGGKGRTGTMICIWLLESKQCPDADTALRKFGERRTDWEKGKTFQGVETPSQSRFVGYYDTICNRLGGLIPSIRTLTLKKIIIHSIKDIGNSDGSDFSMLVYDFNKKLLASCNFEDNTNCQRKYDAESNQVHISNIVCEPLSEEIKVMFYSTNKNVPKYYDECAFFFSFHTSFIDQKTNKLYIPRSELDNPHKEKFWNVYNENFACELIFEENAP